MCQSKTISNNSFGCLIQCKNCEQFHLGFGNVVLILSYDEFMRFSDQVHHIHTMHYEEKKETGEKIYMHTDSSKMVLAFNHQEWMKLYQLLEESRFLLYANELIEKA
jgi:predicted transcriptional regulator